MTRVISCFYDQSARYHSSLYKNAESVYIKTQNTALCRQKEFVFSLGLFNQEKGIKFTAPIFHIPGIKSIYTWHKIYYANTSHTVSLKLPLSTSSDERIVTLAFIMVHFWTFMRRLFHLLSNCARIRITTCASSSLSCTILVAVTWTVWNLSS